MPCQVKSKNNIRRLNDKSTFYYWAQKNHNEVAFCEMKSDYQSNSRYEKEDNTGSFLLDELEG